MDTTARLASIKQCFENLRSICDPAEFDERRLTESQRKRYTKLLIDVHNHHVKIEEALAQAVFVDGAVRSDLPFDLLAFFRNEIIPSIDHVHSALKKLDPEMFDLLRLLDSPPPGKRGAPGSVQFTFEVAIERMQELVETTPDVEDAFDVDRAQALLASNLIDFAPDDWLENARDLRPLVTSRKDVDLPVHMRFRVKELHRSYVLGNWFSVLGLARSILEYGILDNLGKFGLKDTYEVTHPVRSVRKKRLHELIEDVAERLPGIRDDMNRIREHGNEYLHPRRTNREGIFQRQQVARECLESLRNALEALYLAQRGREQ